MRGGLEGGQVSQGARFRLKPRGRAAARLALGFAFSLACGAVFAQSGPAPSHPAATAATPSAPAAAPAAPGSPAPAEPPAQGGKASDSQASDTVEAAPAGSPDGAPADSASAANGQSGQPGDPNTANVNLSTVNVQGKHNVFNDNDKKLKQLQDSLPCTGCDATPHVKKKFVARVLNAVGERVLPTETPDHTNRDPNDRAEEYSQENSCTAANVGGCVQSNLKP